MASALPSDPSAPSGTTGTTEAKGKGVTDSNSRGGYQGWLGGKLFAGARAAVWTETEAGVHTGASGKAFTETGIMTGADIWAEVGPERRPGDTEPAWSREQRGLQARGSSQREPPALSSDASSLAGTVAPILEKPLGLLSKAALTRSFSSSSSKTSSPTTKAAPLRPSSSPPPSPGNNGETHTVASSSVSAASVNGDSSASNSSSHWGKKSGRPGQLNAVGCYPVTPARRSIIIPPPKVYSFRNLLCSAVWPQPCNLSIVSV